MFVGTARLVIHIPAAQSLKDRRRVVNQLKERIRARLSVSVCEVGNAEQYQVARIGLATVSRDAEGCRRVIAAARSMAESLKDAILADAKGEVLAFGSDGEHLRGGIESGPDTWIAGDDPPRHYTDVSDKIVGETPEVASALTSDQGPARPARLSKRLRKEQ